MINRLGPRTKAVIGFVLLACVPVIFLLALQMGKEVDAPEVEAELTEVGTPAYVPVQAEKQTETKKISVSTDQDKLEAQEVAAAFVAAFHSIDTEQPFAYLEEAGPYMTDQMKASYKDVPKRGTLAVEEIRILGMESTPSELQSDVQIWTIDLFNEQIAADGSTTTAVDQYSVLLIKTGGQWLVDGVKAIEQR